MAAIDCGTNSVRLLVADTVRNGDRPSLRDVHRELRIVRLGQGVDATGVLAAAAIERTRAALADYRDVLRRTRAERVRMVATSATRDAANREDFFGMVRATLGIDAEVISGDDEARLSFTGAVAGLDSAGGPFLVVDVGGGSTELVVGEFDGRQAHVWAARSVDIGCVRITERCLQDDPPTAAQIQQARHLAAAALAEAMDEVPIGAARTWVGVAGTITTLSAIAMDLPGYDPAVIHLSTMSRPQIHRVTERLLGAPRAERAAIGSMHPGRVDVIAGGALIVDVLAEQLSERAGITELVVSEHDILDGVALALADG